MIPTWLRTCLGKLADGMAILHFVAGIGLLLMGSTVHALAGMVLMIGGVVWTMVAIRFGRASR